MIRTALTTAVLVALAVVCLPLRADDAAFTRELKAGVEELKKEGEKLAEDDPNSFMAKDLSELFTNVGQQLIQENAQLRQKETPVEERIPILRRLYLQQMRKIHEMKPDGASAAIYNERMQSLSFYHYNVRSSGGFGGGGGGGGICRRLRELLNIGLNQEDYDSYSDNLLLALMELNDSWSDFSFTNHDHISNLRHAEPASPASGTASPVALMLEFPDGAGSMVDTVAYELTKLDIQLGEQNLTDEERSKKLRERFLEIVQRVGKIWPVVRYNEPTGQILFLDRIGKPRVDPAGNPIVFAYPHKLMSILGLKTVALPASAQPPEPPKPPPPASFTAQLEEAVYQLTERGREIAKDDPSSVMAQNLANLFSEIGNQLLLQNGQMEAEKTPDEERIPILRQQYLRQMRQIHEMKPDGNSMVLYNEREQSLFFYHYGPTGGGGGGGTGFSSKLQSLLKFEKSIVDDPAASELTEGLMELSHRLWDLEHKHRSEIRHIVEREIVPPNPGGLTPPPPTPLERSMRRNLRDLMRQIEYELTKLDVELAEQKTPREERVKKLRNLFFEIIRKVEYIGLEVQVEGAVVKIPFRDARGPILDSAGAPIAFEFPPKLMAALMISSASQGSAKRLQLLLGGGAALLLLVLAGVFLVMKRGSAKEADRNAEAES